ncbi:MAG: helix-turn-helix domain-containing protein [Caldilineaceae bacterium]
MDIVFKALAEPNRRKLLDLLFANNGQTLTQLCEQMDIVRQSVTKHLALLEEANLIVIEWRGREKLHYLNPIPIQDIYDRWIGKYERSRLQALGVLKQTLEEKRDV